MDSLKQAMLAVHSRLRPTISVAIEADHSVIAVSVNDVPVYDVEVAGHTSARRGATLYFKEGVNEIRVEISPPVGKKGLSSAMDATIKLMLNDIDYRTVFPELKPPEYEERQTLATLSAKGDVVTALDVNRLSSASGEKIWGRDTDEPMIVESSAVSIEPSLRFPGGVSLSRTVTTNIPFPRWKWLDSDSIENNESTKQSLLKEYIKIWNIMQAMDEAALKAIRKEVSIEKKTFYLSGKEKKSSHLSGKTPKSKRKFFDSVREDIKDLNVTLDTIDMSKTLLRVHGDGRLAELVTYNQGYDPLIIWRDPSGFYSNSFNLMFRREKGVWIRTR